MAYETLAADLSEIFRTRDRAEWEARLEEAVVPFGVENELQDLESDSQIKHLDVFYDIEHPRHGTLKAPRRPVRVDGSREIDVRPPPTLASTPMRFSRRSDSILPRSRRCGAPR